MPAIDRITRQVEIALIQTYGTPRPACTYVPMLPCPTNSEIARVKKLNTIGKKLRTFHVMTSDWGPHAMNRWLHYLGLWEENKNIVEGGCHSFTSYTTLSLKDYSIFVIAAYKEMDKRVHIVDEDFGNECIGG